MAKNEFQDTAYNQFFNPSSTRSNPYLQDENCNNLNQYQYNQVQAFQKRSMGIYDVYIANYSNHFRDDDGKKLADKFWCHFSLITLCQTETPLRCIVAIILVLIGGMFYCLVTAGAMVRHANAHAVAVENGLPGVTDWANIMTIPPL